jgi:hypothetical protein
MLERFRQVGVPGTFWRTYAYPGNPAAMVKLKLPRVPEAYIVPCCCGRRFVSVKSFRLHASQSKDPICGIADGHRLLEPRPRDCRRGRPKPAKRPRSPDSSRGSSTRAFDVQNVIMTVFTGEPPTEQQAGSPDVVDACELPDSGHHSPRERDSPWDWPDNVAAPVQLGSDAAFVVADSAEHDARVSIAGRLGGGSFLAALDEHDSHDFGGLDDGPASPAAFVPFTDQPVSTKLQLQFHCITADDAAEHTAFQQHDDDIGCYIQLPGKHHSL